MIEPTAKARKSRVVCASLRDVSRGIISRSDPDTTWRKDFQCSRHPTDMTDDLVEFPDD